MVTKDGAIERIDVLDSRESAGLGDVCMEKLGKLIVDNQTLNVDVVTGASLSSMAYLTAVAEALDKAGEKSSEWKKRDKAVQQPASDIPTAYDVVVVGAGGAGFTAAISAANKGQNVLLMEKLGVFGGSTALSGGEMAVPGNPAKGSTSAAINPITGKQAIKTKSILFIFLSVLFVYKSFFVNNSVIKSSLSKSPSMYTKVITPFLLTLKRTKRLISASTPFNW